MQVQTLLKYNQRTSKWLRKICLLHPTDMLYEGETKFREWDTVVWIPPLKSTTSGTFNHFAFQFTNGFSTFMWGTTQGQSICQGSKWAWKSLQTSFKGCCLSICQQHEPKHNGGRIEQGDSQAVPGGSFKTQSNWKTQGRCARWI